jgi:hypothetical protein
MTQTETFKESEMKRYSDLEIDLLIEDLTTAAGEAIEKAAAEAAKAATMASLDREAAVLAEITKLRNELQIAREKGLRNIVISGTVFFIGGLAVGVGGVLILGGR